MQLFSFLKKIAIILFCLAITVSAAAEESEFNQYLDDLAAEIAAYTTQDSGYVIYLKDNDVYLDVGLEGGGKLEQEWEVVREFSDLMHPVTRQSVGKSEQVLGQVVIHRIREKLSLATPRPPLTADKLQAGDRVYLANRPKKLAVMRLMGETAVNTPFYTILSEILTFSLGKQPLLEITGADDVEANLKKFEEVDLNNYNGFLGQKTAMKIGKLLGVDGILVGNIFKGKGKYLINVRLLDAKDGRTIRFFEKYIPETEGIKAFIALRPADTTQKDEQTRRLVKIGEEEFEYNVLGQGLSDVDSDGLPELVVLTKEQLRFYNWDGLFFNEKERVGVNPKVELPLFSRLDLGNLVITDLNRNRRPEIYYSQGNMSGGEMVEWDGNAYVKSTLAYYHPLTAYQGAGGNQILVMGTYLGSRNYFQRDSVKEVTPGSYPNQLLDKSIQLPADFYQLVSGDIDNDGKNEWLTVDTADRINVYEQDLTLRWQSTPFFGTALFLLDLDNDGRQEVVASSKSLPGEEDRFYVLKWDGISLSKMFVSPAVSGSIYHLCGGDLDGDKEPEIIISYTTGEMTAANSRIQIYKVK